MTQPKSVAIIGGGISGLSSAYYLWKQSPQTKIHLFEASDRLGGMLRTTVADGWLIESSADSFLSGPETPASLELADEIGFADQLIETNRRHRRALVAFDGGLHAVPKGFQLMGTTEIRAALESTLLTRSGRLRLARERSVPPRTDGVEESLSQFARRRLGDEAFERLVQPLVAGIYSADPEKLSVEAALPRFTRMEREHGSLYEGLLARQSATKSALSKTTTGASGARYGLFQTPRDGMESLVRAIVSALPSDSYSVNTAVRKIAPTDSGGWQLSVDEVAGKENSSRVFEKVIVALPTHRIPALVSFDAELVDSFGGIPYASVIVACVGYRREQIEHPLNAFGIVVPTVEKRRIIAVSFSSVKFPGRAPDGHELMRVFIGGACRPEMFELDDSEVTCLVRDELREVLGVSGEPVFSSINRWQRSSPQYHIGHAARVSAIESRLAKYPGLLVAGNAYRGVGIPQSVASGRMAARMAMESLASTSK